MGNFGNKVDIYPVQCQKIARGSAEMTKLPEKSRDPQDKFRVLAVARVNRTLQDLRLVGNLANRKSYDWDETQARKIIKALEQGVEQVKQKFSQTTGKDAGDFTL